MCTEEMQTPSLLTAVPVSIVQVTLQVTLHRAWVLGPFGERACLRERAAWLRTDPKAAHDNIRTL